MISEEKIKLRFEEKLGNKILKFTSLSGGCISDAYKITTKDNSDFLLKYNPTVSVDMFVKEANGLKELSKSKTIRIPEVLGFDKDYILLEYITTGDKRKNFFQGESNEKFVSRDGINFLAIDVIYTNSKSRK